MRTPAGSWTCRRLRTRQQLTPFALAKLQQRCVVARVQPTAVEGVRGRGLVPGPAGFHGPGAAPNARDRAGAAAGVQCHLRRDVHVAAAARPGGLVSASAVTFASTVS